MVVAKEILPVAIVNKQAWADQNKNFTSGKPDKISTALLKGARVEFV